MKRFVFGLISGICLGMLACYFLVTPKVAEQSYKRGITAGTAEGIETGVAREKAEQKKIAARLQEEAAKKKAEVPKKVPKPRIKEYVNENDKNFDVYGNQIGGERKIQIVADVKEDKK